MKKNAATPKPIKDDDFQPDFDIDADEGDGPPVKPTETVLVSSFIRMMPRAIFDNRETEGQKGLIANYINELKEPGVYILYEMTCPFMWARQKESSSTVYGSMQAASLRLGAIFGIIFQLSSSKVGATLPNSKRF